MTAQNLSSQALPLDRAAAARMWDEYREAFPNAVRAASDYTVEHFGDHAALADDLLALVLSGKKRATAELFDDFAARGDALPRIGSHWIACDSSGQPRIIIRSTDLRIGPFGDGDEEFAAAEAEDDGSLLSWQEGHRAYWKRTSAARGVEWSETDEIVFERFAVVWPPEVRDEV